MEKLHCVFCSLADKTILWEDDFLYVILADEPDYPGFFRVILKAHVREMSDLSLAEQQHLMHVVFVAEKILRQVFFPDKVNLASLGNQVPHMHWHVIARWEDDPHFPEPVWASRVRDSIRSHKEVVDHKELSVLFTRALSE